VSPHEAALPEETIDDGRGRRKVLESESRRASGTRSPEGEKAMSWSILAFSLCTVLLVAFAVYGDRFGGLEAWIEGASVLAIHANIDRGRVIEF